jgi:hypothetical protein
MNAEWLSDFRKIPDEVMNYLRRIAVRAVEDQHYSPRAIALCGSRTGLAEE